MKKTTIKRTITKAAARQELERYADGVSASDVKNMVGNEAQIRSLFTHVDSLSRFAEDFSWVFRMLKDYLAGRYKEVPWRTIALLAGAITYALSPLDLIPDFISVLGWSDDALVIAAVLGSARLDIEEYKAWKSMQNQTPRSAGDCDCAE